MKQDQIGFEVFGEIRRAVCTAKEVDPDGGVDQDHWAPFRIGSRRREAASTSGTFPRSAANRRRAASSTSAFRPSRTATDLVAAPVTRTASSRRSRSISIVVLMHRASHESYAGSNDDEVVARRYVARPCGASEAPDPLATSSGRRGWRDPWRRALCTCSRGSPYRCRRGGALPCPEARGRSQGGSRRSARR